MKTAIHKMKVLVMGSRTNIRIKDLLVGSRTSRGSSAWPGRGGEREVMGE